ncbi:DUF4250 domain-containing protein [Clostridium sp. C105KSO13]|uniref:DUF4250 domain-containing protein n=1 Tax=Clostridium sp. C105KSO13 TaxID=1776045 RepID=UPI0007408421|nr:DUF4250 domain-containing protein [Clostridium sp. C105KSO13]CUX50374.1 hypothetical protein BN3456_02925 [Clostridium sp. C105KSO13]
MLNGLPKDPVILLSVINTRLRDYYKTLDELCEDIKISPAEVKEKLKTIDYEYDAVQNQFV